MKFSQIVFGVLLVTMLSSCATTPADQSGDGSSAADDGPVLATSAAELAAAKEEESKQRESVVYRGNDRLVNMPAKEEPVRFVGDDVSLNFEQAPLDEVTHAILGDILNLDYLVDSPIKGQVTLRTRTPIPREQLLEVLESLLKANNTILLRRPDGRYLVTGENNGVRLAPRVSNPNDSGAGFSTIIVPLNYISASNMAEILRPVAEESAFVRVDNSRNLLMLAGTREQLDGWQDMIATFDVDQLKGMSVGLFPLENSSVEEVAAALTAMMGGADGEGNMADLIRVVPVERLNSILIVTPRVHYLESVQKWIERLDDAHHSDFDSRLYVYPVQNTTAARLADLLNNIYSGSGGQRNRSSGLGDTGGVAPGLTPETLGSGGSSFGSSANGGGNSRGTASSSNLQLGGMVGESETATDVRVVADDENNALIIYASPMQYRVIEGALKQLDIEATQIIIEASIMEVTLSDSLRYGLEWTFNNSINGGYSGEGILSSIDGATSPSSILPGFSYSVVKSAGDIRAVLNVLAQESLLNIISSPSVMVLDNQTAMIHVGQQVPIISSNVTNVASDTGRVIQSIEYRDTGVKLEVTPSVNAGGLVTMDVKQSVTDVGDSFGTGASAQPSFLERNIESRVAVRSGQSVVLGGLIQENSSTGSQGLPWLHKIPLLGGLFGTDSESKRRTELLVVITPRALYNAQELREVSQEMRSRIRNLDLIEPPK
ncbi:type II secretion system protein GspD [Mangrovimicrobium sediminis]|uniref:Type II secretion system protein GspD n=1 Tax=Mangrovimicrobium sediminis TaxID=2562682 RepID=A0A4Z0M3T3_9GAMM|nr:type II secretion system secretin GspD [Haliea sp. SAOS-164]TGD74100.1 type II secretion system protein GspD [Haliea sp. SAOS-164]